MTRKPDPALLQGPIIPLEKMMLLPDLLSACSILCFMIPLVIIKSMNLYKFLYQLNNANQTRCLWTPALIG